MYKAVILIGGPQKGLKYCFHCLLYKIRNTLMFLLQETRKNLCQMV